MKINKKKILTFAVVVAGLALLPVMCNYYLEWQMKMQAQPIIKNVEQYMAATGEAPNDLDLLGYEADIVGPTGPFYNKVAVRYYQIFYRSGDNSYLTYDSRAGEWSSNPPVPPKTQLQMPQ